jgi:hypothetical protein
MKLHLLQQPAATRIVHAMRPNSIDVTMMASLDPTEEASQRGGSAIVIETAPRRIFVVKLDWWHPGVKGCCAGHHKAVKRSKEWCSHHGASGCVHIVHCMHALMGSSFSHV